MNYAVDYHPVGDSYVIAWEDGQAVSRIILESGKASSTRSGVFGAAGSKKKKSAKLAARMKKADFIGQLGADDTVYTELGGQNDKFCIAAVHKGVRLLRLPTGVVKDETDRRRVAGQAVTQEDIVANILHSVATVSPELFYPFRIVEDLRYLEIRLLSRSYWMVQRDIRISTANRLRHLQQDLDLLGTDKSAATIQESISNIIQTIPEADAIEHLGTDSEQESKEAMKFYEGLENKLKKAIQAKLQELPLYHAVFTGFGFNLIGVAGYVIGQVLDIRRFPTVAKFKAFAGYHLLKVEPGDKLENYLFKPKDWRAPKPQKGQRANWDHMLQQAVYYFVLGVEKLDADSPWKRQLNYRKNFEIGKLLQQARAQGKPIPADMTAEKFNAFVADLRRQVRNRAAAEGEENANKKVVNIPEPYTGIPVVARKRALRWLGQMFIIYICTEWRRFEGISEPADQPIHPSLQYVPRGVQQMSAVVQ